MIYRQQPHRLPSSESGFTIIESLMAIVVVGILMTAIAPVIVLSVATRVQARRVELASNAAKSYIDGVRSGTIVSPNLPSTENNTTKLIAYDAPQQGTLTCNANSYCTLPAANLYCIDGDGGGCSISSIKDMIVQGFRYNKQSRETEDGYSLGVRVYRADAFDSRKVTQLKASKDNKRQQNTFTGGTGLTSVQTPLVEITTEISTKTTSFDDFCKRLDPRTDPTNPADPNTNRQSQC